MMMILLGHAHHSTGGANMVQTILNGIIRGFSWRVGSNIGRGIPFGFCLLIAAVVAICAWYFYQKRR
ncbi:hypothetical protein [Fructobacillus evanidus]|uniref:Uncharacterized protein n=1 Tax=Fructobacillus evanidus TaxID=3064281 RepID=A0ABM9MWZ0_9LACO|nr:unnamed protein product [Fructobacillus sp. LMG 32999]CAK1229703.1 unnamed protein product [Fructobacillus sp. LMG 32999]CAK1230937.1 unnamed protein product [Fructobacillus sp. LMG 32999]CAK1231026.1 unnamed protein product [Fructobacillus sp. LMG 32999]CAK1232138.1 unnamed protein product [Fructobacillus sp. LMG 32999]